MRIRNPFRKRKKTFVDTQTVKVFEDDTTLPTITESILSAVLQESSVSDEIKNYITNGPISRLNKFYAFGKNRFIYGLPTSSHLNITNAEKFFDTWLNNRYPSGVNIVYSGIGPLDLVHYVKKQLVNLKGYNPTTNCLENIAEDAYVEKIELHIPKAFTEVLDLSLLTYLVDTVNSQNSNLNFLTAGTLKTVRSDFTLVESNTTAPYAVVKYSYSIEEEAKLKNPLGDIVVFPRKKVLTSEINLNLPLDINETVEEDVYFQAMYVVKNSGQCKLFKYQYGSGGILILDNLFTTPDNNDGNYPIVPLVENKVAVNDLASNNDVRMHSKHLLNLLGMNLGSMTEALKENEEYDKIQQAFLFMGCPIVSDNLIHAEYLYKFFEKYALVSPANTSISLSWESGNYKADMAIKSINMSVRSSTSMEKNYWVEVNNRSVVVMGKRFNFPLVQYCKKLTPYTYSVIELDNPTLNVLVADNRYSTHDVKSAGFLIPINKGIADSFSLNLRKELLLQCLHLQVSSLVVVRVKWYQSSWFKAFLIVAAVVITIVSLGAAAPGVAAAFSAGFMAGAAALTKIVIMSLVFKYAADYAIKKWGPENAALAALAILVASALNPGSVNINTLNFSASYLQLSSNLVQAISAGINAYTEEILKATQNDLEKFQKEFDELVDVSEELFPKNDIMRWLPMLILGESPSSFYDRTIHEGNPGIRALDEVPNYVDNALALPSTSATLMRIHA